MLDHCLKSAAAFCMARPICRCWCAAAICLHRYGYFLLRTFCVSSSSRDEVTILASCLSASVPPLIPFSLRPVPYPSFLPSLASRRIASLPFVKCPVGQCIRNRSNQLCAALVHVPSNTGACSSCPASRVLVFLVIVLRLGTGYRGPEMNGGCHSYLVQDVPCYWVCGRSISAPVAPPPGLLLVAPTHSCNSLTAAPALARHMFQKKSW